MQFLAREFLAEQSPPAPQHLRRFRLWLGIDQATLAYDCLGFRKPNGADIVRRWEHQEVHAPTPAAWAALRYIGKLVLAHRESPESVEKNKIAQLLPECLR